MTHPITILNAACHPDPYPYYASLREGPTLVFDAELKCWIASRAVVVQQVLESPACAVRPVAEPVPRNIAGGTAGEVFSNLIRMNEGQAHALPKQVIQSSLRKLDLSGISAYTQQHAAQLARKYDVTTGNGLTQYLLALPVHVMGSILGFEEETLPDLANWMADFVRCLSPLSTAEQIDAAHVAAQALQDNFRQLLQDSQAKPQGFLAGLQNEAELCGWQHADGTLSNLIGLLSQTYEATAGLAGNGLVALQAHPVLLQDLRADTSALAQKLSQFVAEVARYDASVQNTRRFVNQACEIAGQSLQAGDVIVVLLAAANRDAAANADPDMLQLNRADRKVFTFGHGRHACPGQDIAERITATCLSHLLSTAAFDFAALRWTYRASLNGRIPVFTHNI
ncbi:cytochrome P450 [Undibacterium umbellatum]|uniref:Cytochrome P450 n=1 Tax=Undibacterium umbellatum TaxID=2762300 RepID=A0ABR6Z994_9BURK|nr:cytochrome P450 [Undibacterium umbellatum]MBC3908243.1 cytochrome P450 [Undibacterium umbellatum]